MGFDGIATYIDRTILGGALGGAILLVAALWLLYLSNWLWRARLRSVEGQELLKAGAERGLVEQRVGFAPAIAISGKLGGRPLRLDLEGGVRGLFLKVEHGESYTRVAWESVSGDLDGWLAALDCDSREEEGS